MTPAFRRLGTSELLPRYIFAEPLIVRRRVLEVGAVAATRGESAKFLLARGARSVLACDDGLEAVAEAQRTLANASLRFRSALFDDLETGSFDLVLVTDLSRYILAPLLLKELVRLVAPNGYFLGGLRNSAGLALSQISDPEDGEPPPTFGQLLDALAPHFKSVNVATQSPLLGYQLALENAEGLQVDGSLAGTAEAAYFIVVAGQEKPPEIEPTWIQLPPAPLAYAGGRLEEFSQRARGWEERHSRVKEAWEKARREADAREVALVQLKEELEKSREEAARVLAQLELRERNTAPSRESDELAHKVRRLEAELQVARERAEDAERRISQGRTEIEEAGEEKRRAAAQVLASQESARLERARRDELLGQLEDARERTAQAYQTARTEQEAASKAKLELDRALLRENQAQDALRIKTQELVAAKDRELALADGHSAALTGLEALRREVGEAQARVQAAEQALLRGEADLQLSQRTAEGEAGARAELERRLRDEVREANAIRMELETQVRALSTELAGALDERKSLESRVASDSDAHALAQSLEGRLVEARDVGGQWEQRALELGAQLEVERARANRLERDAEGLKTSERAVREEAEAEIARAQAMMQEAEARLAHASSEQSAERSQTVGALEAAQAEAAELAATLRRTEAARDDASAGQEAAERALGQLRAELQELRTEVEASAERGAFHEQSLAQRTQEAAEVERRLQESQDALRQALESQRSAEAAVAQAAAREEVLETTLTQTQGERDAARGELEALQTSSEGSAGELARWKEEARVHEESRSALAQENTALESALREAQSASEERAQALSDAQASLDTKERESAATIEAAQAEVAASRSHAEQVVAERDRLAAELSAISEGNVAAAQSQAAQAAEVERTLTTLRLLEESQARERKEWEARHGTLEGEREALDARLKALEAADAHRETLVTQLESAEAARAQLAEQVEALNARAQTAEAADQQRVQLASLLQVEERERGDLKRQLDEALTANSALNEQVERLEEDALRHIAETRREKNSIDKLQAELDKLRQGAQTGEEERRKRELLEQQAQSTHDEWTGRFRAIDAERTDAQNQLSAQAANLVQLNEEITRLAQREAELSAKLGEKDARWEVLQRRLNAQETELATLRKAAGRSAPSTPPAPANQVQQIYERASAELSQVKAELFSKKPPPKEAPKPPAVVAPPPAKKKT
jgi:chromosome segregation ATPase